MSSARPMRIIAGRWRSRPLLHPSGEQTRPMPDRVKEAVFDILGSLLAAPGLLPPVPVADIFAGSGALGLEAMSRGASVCYFFERHPRALAALRANVQALDVGADARIMPVDAWKERLRDNGLERIGEHCAYLSLLGRRIYVDDSLDGARSVDSVQGGEDKVSGFSGCYCGAGCLEVPHLSHEDNIGVLAKGVPQTRRETRAVTAYFSLFDDACVAGEIIFYRVLDSYDVPGVVGVDLFYQRGKRRALARAGGSCDEYETTRQIGQVAHYRRHPQALDVRDCRFNQPHSHRQGTLLIMGVDAESYAILAGY